jgi:hypothetical protein
MKSRMSEGLTNIGTPLKEAMERTPRPNTPFGLPLPWDATLINEGTKEPEQEPVAWMRTMGMGSPVCTEEYLIAFPEMRSFFNVPLYAAQPQCTTEQTRQWVGLTLEDKEEYLAQDFGGNRLDAMDWAARRLKEKNT